MAGAFATEDDLPINDYDSQTADAIAAKLRGFSQHELGMIGDYEARHGNRATVLDRIAMLTGEEPWPVYDDQSVEAITAILAGAGAETARRVLDYECEHKARSAVVDEAKRLAGG